MAPTWFCFTRSPFSKKSAPASTRITLPSSLASYASRCLCATPGWWRDSGVDHSSWFHRCAWQAACLCPASSATGFTKVGFSPGIFLVLRFVRSRHDHPQVDSRGVSTPLRVFIYGWPALNPLDHDCRTVPDGDSSECQFHLQNNWLCFNVCIRSELQVTSVTFRSIIFFLMFSLSEVYRRFWGVRMRFNGSTPQSQLLRFSLLGFSYRKLLGRTCRPSRISSNLNRLGNIQQLMYFAQEMFRKG